MDDELRHSRPLLTRSRMPAFSVAELAPSDVRFAPDSGRNGWSLGMSAFDPKRTLRHYGLPGKFPR